MFLAMADVAGAVARFGRGQLGGGGKGCRFQGGSRLGSRGGGACLAAGFSGFLALLAGAFKAAGNVLSLVAVSVEIVLGSQKLVSMWV